MHNANTRNPCAVPAKVAGHSSKDAAIGSLRQPRETECSSTGFALGNSSPNLFAVITAGYEIGRRAYCGGGGIGVPDII